MAPNFLTTVAILVTETWLSGLYPAKGLRFCDHLSAATETVAKGVSSGRAAASIRQVQKWRDFCHELGIDPFLEAFEDKVPIL